MSKHGQHVKDPVFKKRFRVKPYFTLDGMTGFPKNEYRVEQYTDGRWLAVTDLEPFSIRDEAEEEAERRAEP